MRSQLATGSVLLLFLVVATAFTVRETVDKAFGAFARGDLFEVFEYVDDDTELDVHCSAPFCGSWEGVERLRDYFEKIRLSVDISKWTYEIKIVDEADGTAIVAVEMSGKFKRSGNEVKNHKMIFSVEAWDGKLGDIDIFQHDPVHFDKAYRTKGEEYFYAFLEKFLDGGASGVVDSLASDVKVDVNFPGLATENAAGKAAAQKLVERLGAVVSLDIDDIDIEASDEDEVWAEITFDNFIVKATGANLGDKDDDDEKDEAADDEDDDDDDDDDEKHVSLVHAVFDSYGQLKQFSLYHNRVVDVWDAHGPRVLDAAHCHSHKHDEL